MKFFVLSPDAAGQVDCVLRSQMLDHMEQASSEAASDVVAIPVSYYSNYRFNEALRHITKPVVLLDMLEFGWQWNQEQENRLGHGLCREVYQHLDSDDWAVLDAFVREHPPLITFKRELRLADRSPTMQPCEHLCYLPIPPLQSKAEFDARRIDWLHCWGWSHPSRALLHADTFRAMTDENIGVISELDHLDGYFKNPSPRTVASIFSPWYSRKPMDQIMALQQQCKISVSLPGAGIKCFRSAEAPIGSIMALREDRLAWSYEWTDAFNCLRMKHGIEFVDLNWSVLNIPELYDIYCEGQQTIAKYESRRYIGEYVVPKIQEVM